MAPDEDRQRPARLSPYLGWILTMLGAPVIGWLLFVATRPPPHPPGTCDLACAMKDLDWTPIGVFFLVALIELCGVFALLLLVTRDLTRWLRDL